MYQPQLDHIVSIFTIYSKYIGSLAEERALMTSRVNHWRKFDDVTAGYKFDDVTAGYKNRKAFPTTFESRDRSTHGSSDTN